MQNAIPVQEASLDNEDILSAQELHTEALIEESSVAPSLVAVAIYRVGASIVQALENIEIQLMPDEEEGAEDYGEGCEEAETYE